jgi:hypothetical protein
MEIIVIQKTKRRTLVKAIVLIIVILITLFLFQRLLVPKYVDDIVEGAFVAEYYNEEKDFDVIFVGDCEVYSNFSPFVLWEQYGINAYIRGSADQYIWQSYYLLEDALRYETPKAVIFNVLSLQYDESQKEAYNRMSIEGMRWSPSKVKVIYASMKEGEKFLDYVFPILRYHSRWSEITKSDFKYMFSKKPVTHNGYYMRVGVKPAENVPAGKPLSNYNFGENAWKYMDKLRTLCEERGIQLILVKAPSLYPYWYDEWEAQVDDYASRHDLLYINFLELIEETGIDYNEDTLDAGLHLNLRGAEKLSIYLGKVLSEAVGLKDRRSEEELAKIWEIKARNYETEKSNLYEKYGYN